MPQDSSVEKWLYRDSKRGSEEGPLDLVEMAGLLRAGDIAPDTLTKTVDDPTWKPFQDRREYAWARDMPPGVIMKHLEIKSKKPESPFTPRRLYYLGALLLGVSAYLLKLLWNVYYWGANNHDSNQWLVRLMSWLIRRGH
jgi:hypothetical protein